MRGARGRLLHRVKGGVVVEGLVVGLEADVFGVGIGLAGHAGVDDAALQVGGACAIGQRGVPGAAIPGPAQALGAEQVADGGGGLWRQGRLHGVDGVELAVAEVVGRGQVAAELEARPAAHRRGRALCAGLQARQIGALGIGFQDGDGGLGRRGIRYWWFRKEPPKAPWKKWSASTYSRASLYRAEPL
ncbi:unnamed protein product [Victoria cruziana]